ncbi:MAG: VWA domain-containing protein [Sphingobacteriales bacterium]|nr:MAG: VWA domain-containing protein [Sphingobacteriales bacterium]
MRFRFILIFQAIFLLPFVVQAQKKAEFKEQRILILLDGSSSMLNEWAPGKTRFKAASDIISRLIDSVYQANAAVEFSLRVYGHEHPVPEQNCFDTRREVMFSKNNLTQMELRLESLQPRGVSPIAFSLKRAAEEDFTDERDYSYSLILITDGGESCGGDICDVVQTLLDKKVQFKPYIISLVDYAPLKDQYACLGSYLQISKPAEMTPVINTIAEAYRKILAIPVAKPKIVAATPSPKPLPVKIVPATPVVPKTDTVVERITMTRPAPVAKKDTVPAVTVKKDIPVPPVQSAPEKPSNIKVESGMFARENLSSLHSSRAVKLSNISWALGRIPSRKTSRIAVPAPPPDSVIITIERPKPTPPAVPKTQPPANPKPASPKNEKIAEYTMTREQSTQTTLQVYFTNGKGRFYSSTPRMLLVDPKTNKVVHKFFRTIDANGNPDPREVPPGNYDVRYESNPSLVSKNITISPDNNQKLVILVHNSGLKFEYTGNPNRPVKEYVANVKRLFDNSASVDQPCETIREYEPGNYHIEIPGTLPQIRRNLDLEFDKVFVIRIDEPGKVQFTNAQSLGKVALFYQHGDQMERFYNINISGNREGQILELVPGPYEARYQGKIVPFTVKSNQTTDIELK